MQSLNLNQRAGIGCDVYSSSDAASGKNMGFFIINFVNLMVWKALDF